jgi:hypothetical protein
MTASSAGRNQRQRTLLSSATDLRRIPMNGECAVTMLHQLFKLPH